jgi:hypothetical protein
MDPIRCSACGGPTKLIRFERHPEKPDTGTLTFQCIECGGHEVASLRGGYVFWDPRLK